MNKRILVTGSAGFVGSRLVGKLADLGIKVIAADLKNGVDLTSPDSFLRIKNVDIVVHLAAITSVPASFENPWRFLYTNYTATLGALELCRLNSARMIHLSSYLYGPPIYLPINENHPIAPHNPYAQSKKVCEDLCFGYNRDFNVPVTIFRPFNLYGPGMIDNSLIPSIIRQLETNFVALQDPEPKRDYLFIDDLIEAIVKAIDKEPKDLEVYNLGSGTSISVREVADLLIRLSGSKAIVIESHHRRKGEVMDCIADISKVGDKLGWTPKWSINDGLKSLLDTWGK